MVVACPLLHIISQVPLCAVLLVDELDQLITKNERVLYNLFEWPSRKGSKLIVIGIANTMDLPERLSSRIGSRMGRRHLA